MKKILVALSAISALGACADPSAPPAPPARVYDDGNYITGSNLPRRGSTRPPEAQTVSREALEEWQRARTGPKPAGAPF